LHYCSHGGNTLLMMQAIARRMFKIGGRTRVGELPIDRSNTSLIVPQLVTAFEEEQRLLLALAPEGTRKWTTYCSSCANFTRRSKVTGPKCRGLSLSRRNNRDPESARYQGRSSIFFQLA